MIKLLLVAVRSSTSSSFSFFSLKICWIYKSISREIEFAFTRMHTVENSIFYKSISIWIAWPRTCLFCFFSFGTSSSSHFDSAEQKNTKRSAKVNTTQRMACEASHSEFIRINILFIWLRRGWVDHWKTERKVQSIKCESYLYTIQLIPMHSEQAKTKFNFYCKQLNH